jgi:hypothetical protein
VLKGCYPSLHRSRLPPIFFLPFLFVSCSLVSLYMFIERTFEKNSLSSRTKRKEEKQIFFHQYERREEEQKYICSLVQWLSQFHHDEMHITSLSMLCWLLSSESYLYMNTLLDIEHWLSMSKIISPKNCRFMLR